MNDTNYNKLANEIDRVIVKNWKTHFLDPHDIISLYIFTRKVLTVFYDSPFHMLYIIIYLKRIETKINNMEWKYAFIGFVIIALKHSNYPRIDNLLIVLNTNNTFVNSVEKKTLELLNNNVYIKDQEIKYYKIKIKLDEFL